MEPIHWYIRNVICDGNEKLNDYIWNWWSYLIQFPEEKLKTILVLKSILQRYDKNIIINFISNKVLGSVFYYATSDLGKILGKFNSIIKGRKLVVINETGMASGEWHKFNDHLKSLISENKINIEYKGVGVDTTDVKDYIAYMVTSNHNVPLKVEMSDGRIVCFDISAWYRGNRPYFKNLEKILNHPDALEIVMSYLLSRDLSNWDPEDISSTKMKTETICDQLPNPMRFIIQHISS
ncbi:hypothetical protein Glove_117g270 [Diversispora epigaea]|uniref:NrS-1 polymerase-like helicase domain-containing protein n=1 Tax=Diversispora epigaea TaxID=1348612 RepID=A0A397J034_9GLOM|nr:hypothetical protein Glove_117g270 [Diversispora epigaea]